MSYDLYDLNYAAWLYNGLLRNDMFTTWEDLEEMLPDYIQAMMDDEEGGGLSYEFEFLDNWLKKPVSIIDRDIAFYEGEVERLTDDLRRCSPDQEPKVFQKRIAVSIVVWALEQYRKTL